VSEPLCCAQPGARPARTPHSSLQIIITLLLTVHPNFVQSYHSRSFLVLQSSLFVPFSFFSPPERPKQSSIPTTSPAIDNNCCQCFKSHNENGPIPSPFASTKEGPSTRRVQCSAAQRSASHKQTLRLLNVVRFFRTTTFVAPPFVQPFSLHQGLFASEPRRPLHSFIIHSIYHHPIIKANLVVDPPVTASSPSVTHLTRLPVLPYSPQHRHRLRTQPSISTAAAIKLQRRLWTKKQQPSASTCQPSDALTATNKLPPRTLSLLCELIRRSLSTSRLIRHTLVIATL